MLGYVELRCSRFSIAMKAVNLGVSFQLQAHAFVIVPLSSHRCEQNLK